MNSKNYVSTNIRIPKEDWRQIRASAGELGISANKYINYLIKKISISRELGMPVNMKKELPIWNLKNISTGAGKGMSKEDALIY